MNPLHLSRFAFAFAFTLVALLASPAVTAQHVWPEGELPALPDDGSPVTPTLTGATPLIVVASTDRPDGTRAHAIVWESGLHERSWLYTPTQLTFFAAPRGGRITLRVVDGKVTATGAGVGTLVWPDMVENWSFSSAGRLPGAQGHLFKLSVSTGSGCPGTVSDHWLKLDGGALTTMLRTGGTGEGGGDTVWFSGTVVVWPEALAGRADDAFSVKIATAFPPITDIPVPQRVVVYEVDVEEGVLRRGRRVVYRLARGGLQRVREEEAAAAEPMAASTSTTAIVDPASEAAPPPALTPPATGSRSEPAFVGP